jgi:hypothetical protein
VTAEGAAGYSLDLAPPGERDPTTWFAGVRRDDLAAVRD